MKTISAIRHFLRNENYLGDILFGAFSFQG